MRGSHSRDRTLGLVYRQYIGMPYFARQASIYCGDILAGIAGYHEKVLCSIGHSHWETTVKAPKPQLPFFGSFPRVLSDFFKCRRLLCRCWTGTGSPDGPNKYHLWLRNTSDPCDLGGGWLSPLLFSLLVFVLTYKHQGCYVHNFIECQVRDMAATISDLLFWKKGFEHCVFDSVVVSISYWW